jgi:hypothetical protein
MAALSLPAAAALGVASRTKMGFAQASRRTVAPESLPGDEVASPSSLTPAA